MRLSRRRWLTAAMAVCWSRARRSVAAGGTPQRDVPWLAEVQGPAARPAGERPRLSPLLVDRNGRPIEAVAAWEPRREQIRRWWLDFIGMYDVPRTAPPRLELLAEDREAGVVRQLVGYEVEPGEMTQAYLLKPLATGARRAGIVVLHSTQPYTIRQPAGLEGPPEKHFGLKLAQRGFVAFCPRCYLWTQEPKNEWQRRVDLYKQRHPHSTGMAKMLFDAITATDILAGLPEVDPQRLGTVGHSLGGKETLYLAAFDKRIKATVSSEGGIGTRLSNWDAPWYLGDKVRRADFRREHHELLALVAPRPFLLLGGNSADGVKSWPFLEAALPVYRLYGGTPRLGMFNHAKGHSVPPEAETRLYEWLDTYLS